MCYKQWFFLLEKVRKGEIMNKENSDVITRIKEDLSLLDKDESLEIVLDLKKIEKDKENE